MPTPTILELKADLRYWQREYEDMGGAYGGNNLEGGRYYRWLTVDDELDKARDRYEAAVRDAWRARYEARIARLDARAIAHMDALDGNLRELRDRAVYGRVEAVVLLGLAFMLPLLMAAAVGGTV